MNKILPPRRLLARSGNGWQLRELLDGSLHLKLGEPGVVFSPGEFAVFVWLLIQGVAQPLADDVVLAWACEQRSVVYSMFHGCVVVQFDQVLLYLKPRDFRLLAALCQHASKIYTARPIRPALSNIEAALRWN